MRILKLLSIGCLLWAVSCAKVEEQTQTESQTQPQPLKQERSLTLQTGLVRAEYALSTVIEAAKPLSDHVYILAKSGNSEIQIRNTGDFSRVVREIASEAEALEFARLISSQKLRPFLQDIYYTEIHKKANADDRWFAIESEQYEAWALHDPIVAEEDGIYVIDRFVACYPRLIHSKVLADAKLVKIREWITSDGRYETEIRTTVAEGENIRKILIFTK